MDDQQKNFFESGIKALPKRWRKCVELHGEYVEKSQLPFDNSMYNVNKNFGEKILVYIWTPLVSN